MLTPEVAGIGRVAVKDSHADGVTDAEDIGHHDVEGGRGTDGGEEANAVVVATFITLVVLRVTHAGINWWAFAFRVRYLGFGVVDDFFRVLILIMNVEVVHPDEFKEVGVFHWPSWSANFGSARFTRTIVLDGNCVVNLVAYITGAAGGACRLSKADSGAVNCSLHIEVKLGLGRLKGVVTELKVTN